MFRTYTAKLQQLPAVPHCQHSNAMTKTCVQNHFVTEDGDQTRPHRNHISADVPPRLIEAAAMSIYVSIDGTEHVASIEGQHINSDFWLVVKEVLTRNGTNMCLCILGNQLVFEAAAASVHY